MAHKREKQQQQHTVTFDVSESDRDANGLYTFVIPERLRHVSRIELASFSCQAVESSVTADENVVAFTEGFSLSTGESPTILAGGASNGVPVFAHELCIVEGAERVAFKIGLCPKLNEISTAVWDAGTTARLDHQTLTTTVSATDTYFSTTRNMDPAVDATQCFAAPHYGLAFQQLKAQQQFLQGMKFEGVCMCTAANGGRLDLSDALQVDFSDASPAAPTFGGTQFRLKNPSTQLFDADAPSSPTVGAVVQGFLYCTPWFVPDAVAFLNFQLSSVTDSVFSAATTAHAGNRFNRCHTTGARPKNQYRFCVSPSGNLYLAVTGPETTVQLYSNSTSTEGTYAWHSVHDPHGAGTNDAVTRPAFARVAVAPTGSGPDSSSTTNLMGALGFSTSASVSFLSAAEFDVHDQASSQGAPAPSPRTLFGFAAGRLPAGAFETTIDAAHYTAQTLASSCAASMNLHRPLGTAADPAHCTAALSFVDSTGVSRIVVFSAGHRTPWQLAEALTMALNRLDARGVYSAGRDSFTVNGFGARRALAQPAGPPYSARRRDLYYRVVYSSATGLFTIENREISEFSLANDSLYPDGNAPLVQYPSDEAAPKRASFSLSFRALDVAQLSPSTSLGTTSDVAALDTTAAARMLGFFPERVYAGETIVSAFAAPGSGRASYAQTVTRGLKNDVSSTFAACSRPLDSAPKTGAETLLWQNQVDFRGAGPDARVFPRLAYSVHGSQYNDKKYTLAASHPPTWPQPTGASASALASASLSLTPPKNDDYANDLVATVTSADSGRVVTELAIDAAGTNYRAGDLVVVDNTSGTGSAIARVATVSSGGAVASLALLYSGAGDVAHDATEGCFKINAQGPLRIVDGSDPANFDDDEDEGRDVSRVVVQAALVRESLGTASAGAVQYRSFQSCLPFAPGDAVVLGGNTALLLGSVNRGASVSGFSLTVSRVSDSGELVAATGVVALGAGEDVLFAGQFYRVLQGNCGTVVRLNSSPGAGDSGFTFSVVARGTGHVRGSGVKLFGPIVPSPAAVVTGIVEEVMQPNFRTTGAAAANLESAHLMRLSSDAVGVAPTSYHRDGSLIKVRLPLNCRYVVHGTQKSSPSTLLGIWPLDPPRFQILNSGPRNGANSFSRTDTVWSAFGAGSLSSSLSSSPSQEDLLAASVASTLKMPFEWDLNAHAGLLVTLHEPASAALNNTLVYGSTVVNNVLARITYNASIARSWGTANSKHVDVDSRVRQISVRLRDKFLRDYNFGGRSFSIGFNFYTL